MKSYIRVPWRLAAPLLAVLAFAGCAHRSPDPAEQMAVSQAAVDGAVSAGAQQYAPLELNQARQKLDAAKTALRTDDKLNARRLAEQAEVDARVANAKANAEKSRKAVGEIEQSNRMLREELARPQGRPAS